MHENFQMQIAFEWYVEKVWNAIFYLLYLLWIIRAKREKKKEI